MRHSSDPGEIHNLNDVVYRQYSMYEYHHNLVATHPYSSRWFEWPIDYVPIAYFYQDHRKDPTDPKGCCVYEITSLPNPIIMWFGLLAVPWIAVLAWRERNKAYALIVLTYLLQWLPWIGSPRLTFAYHFYVNIPLICICNAVALAAPLAVGAAPRRAALDRRSRRRRIRRGRGGRIRFLLSDLGCSSDRLERLARADVVSDLGYRTGLAKERTEVL